MKLDDLSSKKLNQISHVFENFFEQKVPIHRLTDTQTQTLLGQVSRLLEVARNSDLVYRSQNSPAYLKLVMLHESLTEHWQNFTTSQTDQLFEDSEVAHAQVILSAQDMIDQVQGMLEDASELQFKELPALVDSIRNQIGADQSNQFNTDANSALTLLVQNLQNAKQQLDTALTVLTGQAAPGQPAMPAPGSEPAGDLGTDLDSMGPPEPDQEPIEPKSLPKGPNLGRERRS